MRSIRSPPMQQQWYSKAGLANGLRAALSADAQATGREKVLDKSRRIWELYF